MQRRAFILLSMGQALHALTRQEVLDRVAPLAGALSQGDTAAFMRQIAADAGDRAELRQHVTGLIARYEVTSSVDVLSVNGDEAELDWYMELRSRSTQSVIERRREKIAIAFSGRSVRQLRPATFFSTTYSRTR